MIRGMLQSELSRISGVTQASISKMERYGIKRADKAVALARALECSVEEILDFEVRTRVRANNRNGKEGQDE